jgi:hypothetical protein
LHAHSEWSPIDPTDEALFDMMFERSIDQLAYENNWAFIAQESRFGGLRYYDGDILLAAVARHPASPFIFVFPPLAGRRIFPEDLMEIAGALRRKTKRRVVFRKMLRDGSDIFLRTPSFTLIAPERYDHPRDIPEDIFPQVVLFVEESLRANGRQFVKIRNQVQHFKTIYHPFVDNLSESALPQIANLVQQWHDSYRRGRAKLTDGDLAVAQVVDTSAYTVFANLFGGRCDGSRFFGKLVFVADSVVGFAFAGRVSSTAAALYCNISLREFRGSSEYLLRALLTDLAESGIQYLNMGGSETKGLFSFKQRFAVKELREAVDLEYIGE